MLNPFKVWLRPLGAVCRIRVEGIENAEWLLSSLKQSLGFEDAERCVVQNAQNYGTFQVPYGQTMPHAALETHLSTMPTVHVMNQPE